MIQAQAVVKDEDGAESLVTVSADDDVVVKVVDREGNDRIELTWSQAIVLRDLLTLVENNNS